jgi:hypothetical protein
MELVTLVIRAMQGDKMAFDHLVAQYWHFVYTICLSQVGYAAEATELTQEVLVRIYRDLAQLREPAKFLPWLPQVAGRRGIVGDLGDSAVRAGINVQKHGWLAGCRSTPAQRRGQG